MDYSPKTLADKLFNTPEYLLQPCKGQLELDLDDNTPETLFEMLINFLFEGILIKFDHLLDLEKTAELNKPIYININNISKEHLLILTPWFNFIGFSIDINTLTYDEFKTLNFNHYCKAILYANPDDRSYFDINKSISNNEYHFFLNGAYKKKNLLKDIYCVCIIDDTVFKISFDFLSI